MNQQQNAISLSRFQIWQLFSLSFATIFMVPKISCGNSFFSEVTASPIRTYRFDGKKWQYVDSVQQDSEWHHIYSYAFKGKTQYTTGFCCSNQMNVGAIRLVFNESKSTQSLYITNSSETGVNSNLRMYSSRWFDQSETKFYVTEVPTSSTRKIITFMNKHHSKIFRPVRHK